MIQAFSPVRPKGEIIPTLRASNTGYVAGESFVTVVDGFIVSNNIAVIYEENIDANFEYSEHPVLMQFILKED